VQEISDSLIYINNGLSVDVCGRFAKKCGGWGVYGGVDLGGGKMCPKSHVPDPVIWTDNYNPHPHNSSSTVFVLKNHSVSVHEFHCRLYFDQAVPNNPIWFAYLI
jgi:hypothetical protein